MGFTYPGNTKAITNKSWLRSNAEIVLGCLIVGLWTLIRLFSHAPNFDQLGQQVLAHQWLHGLHSGSVIGPTNYVLKMIFIYMPLDVVPLPAQAKLVIMTLLVNILTFILIALAIKQIWLEFYPSIKKSFYWPLIYLSLISGSVYWISFSNSRNLEVAGGLFLIWLYIRAQKRPTNKNITLLILLGTLLFFADPLQVYMTLLPVLIYVGLGWVARRSRKDLTIFIKLFGSALLSVLLARLLVGAAENIWNVSFIEAPRQFIFSASSLRSTAQQIAKLYSGGYDGGRWREAINLVVLASGIIGTVWCAWRKPKSRKLFSLISAVWLTDICVYIFSGQAQQPDTNRYLIMTVPMFILALILLLYYLPSNKLRNYLVSAILVINLLTLIAAFANAWDPSFNQNQHSHAVVSYLKANKFNYGYASIGTAISSDYLSNEKAAVLTLGCEPDFTLKKTNLFFDKAAFKTQPDLLVPIFLDGNTIKINQAACGPAQIQKQLGKWQRIDRLSDGSTVLIYTPEQLIRLH